MRNRRGKPVLLFLALAALALAGPGLTRSARAQDKSCEACVHASFCVPKREECVAECRATLFSVDPRRALCIAACTDAANSCIRSVEEVCRAQKRCL